MTVQQLPEQIIFLPGYGEDPDMVRPFTDALSGGLQRDVKVADYYRRNDHRYHPEGLPSRELAARAAEQFGYEGFGRLDRQESVGAVGHSMGARVLKHFEGLDGRVLLAPEGLEKGGWALTRRFTHDIFRQAAFGPWSDRWFAARQLGNILSHPGESVGLASEMMSEGMTEEEIARLNPTLLIAYKDDAVIAPGSVASPLSSANATGVRYRRLSGGHYEPFINPHPTVKVIKDHYDLAA